MENFGVLNLATAMYLSQQKMANQIANFNRQRPVETETVKTTSFGFQVKKNITSTGNSQNLTPTLAAWPLSGHMALKSILLFKI